VSTVAANATETANGVAGTPALAAPSSASAMPTAIMAASTAARVAAQTEARAAELPRAGVRVAPSARHRGASTPAPTVVDSRAATAGLYSLAVSVLAG
jgi:hypothetical protein